VGGTRLEARCVGRVRSTTLRVVPLPVPGRKDRPFRPEMRQGPGRAGRRGDRQPRGQAALREPRLRIDEQARFAAEQVRDRADIDQQPVGPVERAPRPPALRPQGQAFEKRPVARRIARRGLQPGAQRSRIGQPHPGPRPGGQPGIVRRLDPRSVRGFAGEDSRLAVRPFASPAVLSQPPAIDRQPRQPD
jgi:hypothetical protein